MQYIKYTSDKISYKLPIRQANLSDIDPEKLAHVLEDGLKQTFVDVSIKWVKCPDLTQQPFNLAASGLCGKPALMEVGDSAYLEPNPKKDKIYHINEILKFLNRDCSNSFIFGAGISERSNGTLGELVMNKSISQMSMLASKEWKIMDRMNIIDKSCFISINTSQKKCNVKMLTSIDTECSIHGTFFLCEGSVGPVLEVRVTEYLSTIKAPVPGFIDAMQDIIKKTFGPDEFVGLGGVYVTNDIRWEHRLDRHSWEPWFSPMNPEKHRYCNVNVPEAIITTFSNSTTAPLQYSLEFPPIKLTGKSTHCLFHHNGGKHYLVDDMEYTAEYIGYFSPAKNVYRIDESRKLDFQTCNRSINVD